MIARIQNKMVTIPQGTIPLEDRLAQENLAEDIRLAELFGRKPDDAKVFHFTQLGRKRYNPLLSTAENLYFMEQGKDYVIENVPYELPEIKPVRPRFGGGGWR